MPIPQNDQTQSIRWFLPTNCLSVFDHFLRLGLKRLILENKFGDDPLGEILGERTMPEIVLGN